MNAANHTVGAVYSIHFVLQTSSHTNYRSIHSPKLKNSVSGKTGASKNRESIAIIINIPSLINIQHIMNAAKEEPIQITPGVSADQLHNQLLTKPPYL